MIILEMEQGSPEWLQARLGLPTASRADRLLTPKKLQPSAAAKLYRNEILAEWLSGYPLDFTGQSGWMDRGRDLEAEARNWYAFARDVEVATVGFVLRDDEQFGGSPDGLIGSDGIFEAKCTALHKHVGLLLSPDDFADEHRGQVQALLYVTGREWCDLVAYNPQLPAVVLRIERDEAYIAALESALDLFLKDLNAAKERLAPHRAQTVAEVMAAAA